MAQLRFRQVRYFVEIVDAGSITSAARRLNLVPTALSLQIKKLEDEFGVKLLERHARGVSPTETGREYYHAARKILDLVGETKQVLAGRSTTRRSYRFGMTPSFLHTLGVGTLVPGTRESDGISVELVECRPAEIVSGLDSGELDFALGSIEPFVPRSDTSVIEVAEEALVYVTSAAHEMSNDPIDLEDALGPDLISIGSQSHSWSALRRVAAKTGRGLDAAHVVRSSELIRRMLLRDVGAAILPVSFVAPELTRGTLRARPLIGESLKRKLSFAWSGQSQSDDDDRRIIPYVRNLIRGFLVGTAPHSRILDPLSHGFRSRMT